MTSIEFWEKAAAIRGVGCRVFGTEPVERGRITEFLSDMDLLASEWYNQTEEEPTNGNNGYQSNNNRDH